VRWPVLAFASLIQTVPSLALLALFYPFLLAVSRLAESMFGTGFSALGFLPSLLALALYSMLPVIRNGVAGILNIDAAVIEAARGVGMTDWQRLWRVELPLAAPMLMAGIRTAPSGHRRCDVIDARRSGQPRQLIFSGLQLQDRAGAVRLRRGRGARSSSTNAGVIEIGLARRSHSRAPASSRSPSVPPRRCRSPRHDRTSGGKTFEQPSATCLRGSRRRRRRGARRAQLRSHLAASRAATSTSTSTTAARSASVMQRTDVPRREQLPRSGLARKGARHVVLSSLGFENAYGLAMRRDRANSSVSRRSPTSRYMPPVVDGGDPSSSHAQVGALQLRMASNREPPRLRSDVHVSNRHGRRGRRDLGFPSDGRMRRTIARARRSGQRDSAV
jgi:osmoprotectant transport system permease protein